MAKRSQEEVLESIDRRLESNGRLIQVCVFLFIFLAVTLVFLGAKSNLLALEVAGGIAAILIFWAVRPRRR
jgi:lipopolysaccharide export LptBFGC system permease protein LptF